MAPSDTTDPMVAVALYGASHWSSLLVAQGGSRAPVTYRLRDVAEMLSSEAQEIGAMRCDVGGER